MRSGDYYSVLTGVDNNRDSFFTDRPPGEDRNAHEGPWAWKSTSGLAKNFTFGGGRRLELIAEAFNVTNTPQFSTPENRQTSGISCDSSDGRQLQPAPGATRCARHFLMRSRP